MRPSNLNSSPIVADDEDQRYVTTRILNGFRYLSLALPSSSLVRTRLALDYLEEQTPHQRVKWKSSASLVYYWVGQDDDDDDANNTTSIQMDLVRFHCRWMDRFRAARKRVDSLGTVHHLTEEQAAIWHTIARVFVVTCCTSSTTSTTTIAGLSAAGQMATEFVLFVLTPPEIKDWICDPGTQWDQYMQDFKNMRAIRGDDDGVVIIPAGDEEEEEIIEAPLSDAAGKVYDNSGPSEDPALEPSADHYPASSDHDGEEQEDRGINGNPLTQPPPPPPPPQPPTTADHVVVSTERETPAAVVEGDHDGDDDAAFASVDQVTHFEVVDEAPGMEQRLHDYADNVVDELENELEETKQLVIEAAKALSVITAAQVESETAATATTTATTGAALPPQPLPTSSSEYDQSTDHTNGDQYNDAKSGIGEEEEVPITIVPEEEIMVATPLQYYLNPTIIDGNNNNQKPPSDDTLDSTTTVFPATTDNDRCPACRKKLTVDDDNHHQGGIIQYKDLKMHRKCFSCRVCGKNLLQETYDNNNNNNNNNRTTAAAAAIDNFFDQFVILGKLKFQCKTCTAIHDKAQTFSKQAGKRISITQEEHGDTKKVRNEIGDDLEQAMYFMTPRCFVCGDDFGTDPKKADFVCGEGRTIFHPICYDTGRPPFSLLPPSSKPTVKLPPSLCAQYLPQQIILKLCLPEPRGNHNSINDAVVLTTLYFVWKNRENHAIQIRQNNNDVVVVPFELDEKAPANPNHIPSSRPSPAGGGDGAGQQQQQQEPTTRKTTTTLTLPNDHDQLSSLQLELVAGGLDQVGPRYPRMPCSPAVVAISTATTPDSGDETNDSGDQEEEVMCAKLVYFKFGLEYMLELTIPIINNKAITATATIDQQQEHLSPLQLGLQGARLRVTIQDK